MENRLASISPCSRKQRLFSKFPCLVSLGRAGPAGLSDRYMYQKREAFYPKVPLFSFCFRVFLPAIQKSSDPTWRSAAPVSYTHLLGPFHTNVSFQITDPQGSFSIRMKVPVKNHLSERAALHWVCQQLWIIRVLSLKGGTFFYHLPFADTPGFPIQLRCV